MSHSQPGVGTVASLWRYPVKSMAGERLDAVDVTARGLVGDRAYGLVDAEDGKVATAKNPRKWPHLLEYAAVLEGGTDACAPTDERLLGPTLITLPDGGRVSSAEPDADERLTRALGRRVRMQRAVPGRVPVAEGAAAARWVARSEEYRLGPDGTDLLDPVTDFDLPEGTFFDSATVHVLTTASLARLQELYPEGTMGTRRFRPNVLVDTPGSAGFLENAWVGRTLRLGGEVRLEVTGPCQRCVMVTLAQGDLPKDIGVLRTAARHNDTHVGVYASVVTGGRVRAGDPVSVD
jgi:uncharacterized protein YcbX